MTGLLDAIKTEVNLKLPNISYAYGTTRVTTYPRITAEERDLAGETSYQTGGTDIQRVILIFRVWSLIKKEASDKARLLTDAFTETDPPWRPTWDDGKLIDAYQAGVTVTNESDQVDSQNRVIWVSESVIEFLITRE